MLKRRTVLLPGQWSLFKSRWGDKEFLRAQICRFFVRNLTGHQPWTLPTMPPSPLPQPKSRQRQPFPVHKWAAVELRAMDMAGNYWGSHINIISLPRRSLLSETGSLFVPWPKTWPNSQLSCWFSVWVGWWSVSGCWASKNWSWSCPQAAVPNQRAGRWQFFML